MKYVRQMEYFAINRFHTLSANEVYVEVHAEHYLYLKTKFTRCQ